MAIHLGQLAFHLELVMDSSSLLDDAYIGAVHENQLYAFYLGHLSETRRRLQHLDRPEGKSRCPVRRYPSSSGIKDDVRATSPKASRPDITDDLDTLREDLAIELTSPLGRITYPSNLTYANFTDFLFLPSLCYELEYPRSPEGINRLELFYKSLAVSCCIFLLPSPPSTSSSQCCARPRPPSTSPLIAHSDRALILAETISRRLFPSMICFLLGFLVIFEYALNSFAELTGFADRRFYTDWSNTSDWLLFSRQWNIPVHHFLQRHVCTLHREAWAAWSACPGLRLRHSRSW